MSDLGQINKREKYKDITIGTRKFRLNKFAPMTGCYMLTKLIGILAPIIGNTDTKKVKNSLNPETENPKTENSEEGISGSDTAKILTQITQIPKDDFEYIQKNCLMVINEIYPTNPQPSPPVLNEYGEWGILDVDTPLVLNLTIQSLIFNVSGFFGEDLLAFVREGLTTFQQSSQM